MAYFFQIITKTGIWVSDGFGGQMHLAKRTSAQSCINVSNQVHIFNFSIFHLQVSTEKC